MRLSCTKLTSMLPDGTCSLEPDFERRIWPTIEDHAADLLSLWIIRPLAIGLQYRGVEGRQDVSSALIRLDGRDLHVPGALGRFKYTIRDGHHSILFGAGRDTDLLQSLVALWPTVERCETCPLTEFFETRFINDVTMLLGSIPRDQVAFSFGHAAEPLVVYGRGGHHRDSQERKEG
jgi:hypothetical protein